MIDLRAYAVASAAAAQSKRIVGEIEQWRELCRKLEAIGREQQQLIDEQRETIAALRREIAAIRRRVEGAQ